MADQELKASATPKKRRTVRAKQTGGGLSLLAVDPAPKIVERTEPKAKVEAPKNAAPPPKPAAPPAGPTLEEEIKAQTAESWQRLSQNLAEAMTRANNAFSTAFHDQSKLGLPPRSDPFDVQGALNRAWTKVGENPEALRDAHGELWKQYARIWEDYSRRAILGLPNDSPPEHSRDKRFRDPEWRENPAFSLMRETYLATAGWITGLIENAEGLDEASKRKAAFFVKQAVDAASPSNFLFTNPAALKETLRTQGENLLKGAQMLKEDLQRGHGMLSIRQTDYHAFEVGKNIATTPGQVVFRNRLIELLQYAPTTETTFKTPLLIIPPWINKFYILDLQAKNSMIKWLTAQGHTVFVASWVNPDAELAELGFADYMREGTLAAVGAACEAADVKSVNAVGYCIGGTLLATTLAWMAAKGDKRIQSATFFAAQTDFQEAGELCVFTDDAAIRYIAERIDARGGFLDAQAMADTFNSLRANDLIWNYVVENYYLGHEPPPFDLLYWNADQTRMPKTLHLTYLNEMYHKNALAKGELVLNGERIELGNVKIPVFMQASKEDHIAPFRSVYRSARLFGGKTRLMLAGSGHIAGVINHPDAKKYQHWVREDLPATPEEWMSGAEERPGSWWPEWHVWLSALSGPQVKARTPNGALGDAPGTYVLAKSYD